MGFAGEGIAGLGFQALAPRDCYKKIVVSTQPFYDMQIRQFLQLVRNSFSSRSLGSVLS